MNRNVCLYCQEIPGAQTQGCLACEIVNRASSPLQTLATEVFPPVKSFNSTPYLQSFQSDVVYSMVSNEAQRWASSSTMPIVQANGVVGVAGWSGSSGQQGLTELERQSQQQIWADVARGFSQHPNAGAAHPINSQFTQPLEPDFMYVYVRDGLFGTVPRIPVASMVKYYHAYVAQARGPDGFVVEATESYQAKPKEPTGGIVNIPELDPYEPKDVAKGKRPPGIPTSLFGKRSGPVIVKGYGMSTEWGMSASAGPPDPEIPPPQVPLFFPYLLPEQKLEEGRPKGYARGEVEVWGMWYFYVKVKTGSRLTFAIRSNPYYRLIVQTGFEEQLDRPVKAEIRGEVSVSDVTGLVPMFVPFWMKSPHTGFLLGINANSEDPRQLDAHGRRSLDWSESLEYSSKLKEMRVKARMTGATLVPPVQQPEYYVVDVLEPPKEALDIPMDSADKPERLYLLSYIDYIKLDNGNGAAYAEMVSTPKLFLL